MERSGCVVLCSGRNAPKNRPPCRSCCPLSRTEPSVQRVKAEAELVEEMMRVVMMSWKGGEEGLLDRETVGEEVVRETARWALAETGSLLIDGQ